MVQSLQRFRLDSASAVVPLLGDSKMYLFIIVALKCTVALNQPLQCSAYANEAIYVEKSHCDREAVKVRSQGYSNAKCIKLNAFTTPKKSKATK